MERSDFIEAIKNRTSLSAHSQEEWDELAATYPYSSVVQLLKLQRKRKLTSDDKKRLLVHFENPLHLSITLAKYATIEEEEGAVKEIVEKSVEPKVESELKADVLEKEPVLEQSSEPESDVKEDRLEVPVEKQDKDDKDVLELINELPEESPIKRTKASLDREQKEKAAQEQEAEVVQDPGDLMVMMSFTDWLNHFKSKSENEAEDKKGKDAIRSAWQKEKLAEAMDDEEDVVPDEIFEKAMKSVSFSDNLVTEPLAELYVQQGKTEKALELYKKLSLLNPEKRSYFASRIKDLHL